MAARRLPYSPVHCEPATLLSLRRRSLRHRRGSLQGLCRSTQTHRPHFRPRTLRDLRQSGLRRNRLRASQGIGASSSSKDVFSSTRTTVSVFSEDPRKSRSPERSSTVLCWSLRTTSVSSSLYCSSTRSPRFPSMRTAMSSWTRSGEPGGRRASPKQKSALCRRCGRCSNCTRNGSSWRDLHFLPGTIFSTSSNIPFLMRRQKDPARGHLRGAGGYGSGAFLWTGSSSATSDTERPKLPCAAAFRAVQGGKQAAPPRTHHYPGAAALPLLYSALDRFPCPGCLSLALSLTQGAEGRARARCRRAKWTFS